MIVLDSGSDAAAGRSWYLVGARATGRVFIVIVRGARSDVRWLFPHAHWQHCEPASVGEAEAARRWVEGVAADGLLGWNDVERATAIWRAFRDGGTPT